MHEMTENAVFIQGKKPLPKRAEALLWRTCSVTCIGEQTGASVISFNFETTKPYRQRAGEKVFPGYMSILLRLH